MVNNTRKVAILMATYNGERYLEQQLDSIIAQTYSDWSLFIRDDGSTDSTCQILERYQSKYDNIFLIKDNLRLGAKLSFMNLLESVNSEYYMFADQDDYWIKDKVEIFIKEISLSPQNNIPIIVCSDLTVVDEKLNELYPSFWDFSRFRIKDFNSFIFHWYWNNINGCSMMINNFAKSVSFPIPEKAFMHDSWIVLSVLAHNGIVLTIPESTMLYRQHQFNSIGAKRDKVLHYVTDVKSWTSRTYNQYLVLRTLRKITLVNFLSKKIFLRIRQIIYGIYCRFSSTNNNHCLYE